MPLPPPENPPREQQERRDEHTQDLLAYSILYESACKSWSEEEEEITYRNSNHKINFLLAFPMISSETKEGKIEIVSLLSQRTFLDVCKKERRDILYQSLSDLFFNLTLL